MPIARAQEDYHHSPEAVKRYAETACAIADEIGLSDEDRVALLPQMMTLLASKQIWYHEIGAVAPAMAIPRNARH